MHNLGSRDNCSGVIGKAHPRGHSLLGAMAAERVCPETAVMLHH